MAIDLSKVFKANVKAIRMNSPYADKGEILNEQILNKSSKQKSKPKDDFTKEAKNIIVNITILKNFLNENKKFFVQQNYLVSHSNEIISDIDWQNFEDQPESIMKKCGEAIRQLKEKTLRQIFTSQHRQHVENVFYLLEKYLKEVCDVYAKPKAIRIKRLTDQRNLSQLCSRELEMIDKENKLQDKKIDMDQSLKEELENQEKKNFKIENILSEQELAELEKENEMLFDNLSIQSEEVKKIEREVIEVSRLTQIFSENIVSQMVTVEKIQQSAIETNSNLSMGNENIKEAMKKNAALRLWILFIIIVLSFTLLFLDWYND